jgi:hypothetical protein
MMPTDDAVFRSRVLILAPVGRDAALTRSFLNRAGVESLGCSNLDDLQRNLFEGAGAAVITGGGADWTRHKRARRVGGAAALLVGLPAAQGI